MGDYVSRWSKITHPELGMTAEDGSDRGKLLLFMGIESANLSQPVHILSDLVSQRRTGFVVLTFNAACKPFTLQTISMYNSVEDVRFGPCISSNIVVRNNDDRSYCCQLFK